MPGETVCVRYVAAVGGNMWTSSIGGPRGARSTTVEVCDWKRMEGIGMAACKRSHCSTEENPVSSSVEWSRISLACPTLAQEHASNFSIRRIGFSNKYDSEMDPVYQEPIHHRYQQFP